ncbi:NTP transferase domain-containing protein [Lactococcus termiticola]|uniref:Molybdopterin-guanine dinucleotide biosynthesis protein MobA n=1 Tax=Lactococcus termiticola TaxID=2169526 RepID=A0A2R5HF94_9LACT|nr:NTP transferase domain-containing protein [Lactococcus termiticola]GBG96729.1 molybdopterin-guanine dinucleotide biosynthesis protein MobA [Lactococcus termiticola]
MTIGILLAGGKSSRFKQGDKALFFDERLGQSWLEIAFDKLKQVSDEVFISASATNYEKIKQDLAGGHIQLDHSDFSGEGPLSALYSVAKHFPQGQAQDYLILSVDNPEISINSLRSLMRQPNQYAENHFTIAYLRFSADDIESYLQTGQRRVIGFLNQLAASAIQLPDEELVNHNEA